MSLTYTTHTPLHTLPISPSSSMIFYITQIKIIYEYFSINIVYLDEPFGAYHFLFSTSHQAPKRSFSLIGVKSDCICDGDNGDGVTKSVVIYFDVFGSTSVSDGFCFRAGLRACGARAGGGAGGSCSGSGALISTILGSSPSSGSGFS